MLSVDLNYYSGIFVHGHFITFVIIVLILLKSLWQPRKGACYFTVLNSDPYADVVNFYGSKDEVRLYLCFSRILLLWENAFNNQ